MSKRFEKPPIKILAAPIGLAIIGIGFATAGIYVGHIDDAPGAGLLGLLLMMGLLTLSVKMMRRRFKSSAGDQES